MFRKILLIFLVYLFAGCGDSITKLVNTGVEIPVEVYSVSPKDEAGKVGVNVSLAWECLKDSEEYPWNIYFGETADDLELIAENVENCVYELENLDYGKKYYWQVKCTEEDGNVYESEIWNFTTATESGKVLSPSLETGDISSDSAKLSWDKVNGAESYFLYISNEENGDYQEIVSPRIEIYYKTEWESTNIHYGDSNGWTSVPGIALSKIEEGEHAGWVKYDVIGEEYVELTFNYNGEQWDSNNGNNYVINESGVYEIEPGMGIEKISDLENEGFSLTEYTVSDLDSYTDYYFKIRTFDGEEYSDFSDVLSLKTEYPDFSDLPYLTWNTEDESDSSIVVNYETMEEFEGSVEYGLSESLGSSQTGEETGHIHHIKLSNLSPDTKYYYRIIKDNGEYSEIYNFTTAGDDNTVNYVLCSDMQDGIDYNDPARRWEEVANEIAAMHSEEKIDFLLMPGDLLSNDRPENWKIFFDKGASILPYIPMVAVIGNHDTIGDESHGINSSNPNGCENFEEHFALPGNGKNYVIKYENTYITVINSEVLADIDGFSEDEQYDWAKEKIEGEAQDYDWVFAAWHIPAYTVLDRHGEQQYAAREITDFFEGNVDWVFSGHVHSYQRFLPMQYDSAVVSEYGRGNGMGVGYINLPPAGNNPEDYENNDSELLAYPVTADIENGDESEVGFARVTVNGQNIEIKVYGIGDLTDTKDIHLIDTVSYSKGEEI